MSEQGSEVGRCLSQMREEEEEEEEEETGAAHDNGETWSQIQRRGHGGIITTDTESKMESVTTMRATFVPPKSHDVRLKGVRGELMERRVAQVISERFLAEQNPATPSSEYCSTTQRDFRVEGFVPLTPESTQVHDYKTEQAITFWSENRRQIPGVTAAQSPKAPFSKSAFFSTPISERLDESPPDN